jgi:hypothetical protein
MNTDISIEQLQARALIADLVHRYARYVREGTTAECADLFTEDATFETREMFVGEQHSKTRTNLVGREAILSYLSRDTVRGTVCPIITNLLIDVDGQRASSECLMSALVWASGHTLIGEYRDTYCYDGRWRFVSRIYTMFRANKP